MSEDRVFIGNAKEKQLKYGPVLDLVVDVDSIIREYGNHGFETEQGKRKIKIKVAARKEADQYGNTHFVEVDTWHPDNYIPPGSIHTGGTISDYQEKPKEDNKFAAYNPNPPKADEFASYGSGGQETFNDDVPF